MADFIVSLIVIAIVGWAISYIWKAKKSGRACIGCPSSGSCPRCAHAGSGSGSCSGSCGSSHGSSDCGCGRGADCETKALK